MDFTLRCNSLKCRAHLGDRAVVTTCSHIFCVACSDFLGLSGSAIGHRICPACDTQLSNPDDAVVTQLNPTEDYKTSVLSGLSPNLIIECAGRGMAFFQYQTTQEIMYQDYMAKSLTDKYATLSSQMDNVIGDANAEIMSLRDKLSGLHVEKKNLETKNHELANAFREKSRAQQRLQGLYQKLKGQQNAHNIEHAAAHDAESVIHNINGASFVGNVYGGEAAPERPPGAHIRGADLPEVYAHARIGSAGSGGSGKRHLGIRPRTQRENGPGAVTSSQRENQLPLSVYPDRPSAYVPNVPNNAYLGTGGSVRQATPNRQPLAALEPNGSSNMGMPGYGMSGGAKIGRGAVGTYTRSGQGRQFQHVQHR